MVSVLGINGYHGDAAACLVVDGKLVAAAEEERFRRIKHWAGFPAEAIAYCLGEAGLTLGDVDHVAINRDPKANRAERVKYLLGSAVRGHAPTPQKVVDRLVNRARVKAVDEELRRAFPGHRLRATIHHVEHHQAHLASAALVSPFERCIAVSVDGFGDFASAAWGYCDGSRVEVDGSVFFPHSLGAFYTAITQYLGFPHYGDEYKVMGLAPYGEPKHLEALRRVVGTLPDGTFELDLRYFQHHTAKIDFEWKGGAPEFGDLFTPELEKLLGPRRRKDEPLAQFHRDLARSAQARYEECFFHLLHALHRRYRGRLDTDAIAVAGGCGYNSVANGKIHRRTPFRRVYIQSAAGDAGGALGAAFSVWQELGGGARFAMSHAYWGPSSSPAAIDACIARSRAEIDAAGCIVERAPDEDELCRRTAEAVAQGQVVGWFQGRLEWGPRALGNRSIVCDPRRADMKEILNAKIKRRESFRPFAPSVLREAVADWFEDDDDVPFMMQVFPIREERRASIPAVTHVDGTGRLQTVTAADNPRYHRLIRAFFERTGVPMVLNTSFNENEPVVCRPEEALACFLRTRMDLLVLGDVMIRRRG
ncbi:MAG: carbamoyltransferase [Deltaproteobacteria bacterium]|nr:carbamoyltransferase [Deltaproteobacteria bacterium]